MTRSIRRDVVQLRIIEARDKLTARLLRLDQRAAQDAEAFARTAKGIPPSFGRHATDWTARHEAQYRARLAEICGAQRNDRGALASKIARQNAALRARILVSAADYRRTSTPRRTADPT